MQAIFANGDLAERSNALVLKTRVRLTVHRGFESLSLRNGMEEQRNEKFILSQAEGNPSVSAIYRVTLPRPHVMKRMRSPTPVSILMMFALSTCDSNDKGNSKTDSADWQEIRSDEGHFRIEFPAYEVSSGVRTYLYEDREIQTHYFELNTQYEDDDNLAYTVSYSFWPEITSQEQIDDLFNSQRDYLLSAANATLEYEMELDPQLPHGRELYMTVDDRPIKMMYRMFFSSGIIYALAVVTEHGKLLNESLTRFLNSFMILD